MAPDSGTGFTAAICMVFGCACAKAGARLVARMLARPPADCSSARRDETRRIILVPPRLVLVAGSVQQWQTVSTGGTANTKGLQMPMLSHSHAQWGQADQIGAGNLLTVEKRLAALSSVRQGRVYDVSHEIFMGAPYMAPNQTPFLMSTFGSWRDTIKRRRKLGAGNDAGTNLERIEMTAHVGTHIDALGHFSKGDMLYNGNAAAEVVTDWGLDRLGIEHAPPMITRAVLFDVAPGTHMTPGQVVTADH